MSEFKTNPIVQSCAVHQLPVGWLVEIKQAETLQTDDVVLEDEYAAARVWREVINTSHFGESQVLPGVIKHHQLFTVTSTTTDDKCVLCNTNHHTRGYMMLLI